MNRHSGAMVKYAGHAVKLRGVLDIICVCNASQGIKDGSSGEATVLICSTACIIGISS
jgi:hypothetical protein